jgi:hypothetical protein
MALKNKIMNNKKAVEQIIKDWVKEKANLELKDETVSVIADDLLNLVPTKTTTGPRVFPKQLSEMVYDEAMGRNYEEFIKWWGLHPLRNMSTIYDPLVRASYKVATVRHYEDFKKWWDKERDEARAKVGTLPSTTAQYFLQDEISHYDFTRAQFISEWKERGENKN